MPTDTENVRLSGKTGSDGRAVKVTRLPRMYGPAVRCKRFVDLVVSGLASMYPVSSWSCFAPDHHGYQRACDLISGQASTGPFGSPVFACAGKTEPPSLLILSQTSAGKSYRFAYVIAGSSSFGAHLALDDQAAWAVALVFVLASKLRPRSEERR